MKTAVYVSGLILHGVGHLMGAAMLRSPDQLNTASFIFVTPLFLDNFVLFVEYINNGRLHISGAFLHW